MLLLFAFILVLMSQKFAKYELAAVDEMGFSNDIHQPQFKFALIENKLLNNVTRNVT